MSIDNLYGAHSIMPMQAVTITDNTAGLTQPTVIGSSAYPDNTIVFHARGGKEAGRLTCKDMQLDFEGDASMAAQLLMEHCRKEWVAKLVEDKRNVLRAVVSNLIEESSGELYTEGEQLAILTCIHRVHEMINELSPKTAMSADYSRNLAKSMMATKEAVAGSILGALAPEGKSL